MGEVDTEQGRSWQELAALFQFYFKRCEDIEEPEYDGYVLDSTKLKEE